MCHQSDMSTLNQDPFILSYLGQTSPDLSKVGERQTPRSWFAWFTTIGLRIAY